MTDIYAKSTNSPLSLSHTHTHTVCLSVSLALSLSLFLSGALMLFCLFKRTIYWSNDET